MPSSDPCSGVWPFFRLKRNQQTHKNLPCIKSSFCPFTLTLLPCVSRRSLLNTFPHTALRSPFPPTSLKAGQTHTTQFLPVYRVLPQTTLLVSPVPEKKSQPLDSPSLSHTEGHSSLWVLTKLQAQPHLDFCEPGIHWCDSLKYI